MIDDRWVTDYDDYIHSLAEKERLIIQELHSLKVNGSRASACVTHENHYHS